MTSIILIDDDADAIETLNAYFEETKIDVCGYGYDGKDAVELYKKHNPDIVLLDLAMPKFDGIYGIENIQKINPKAKIIILTGSVDLETRDRLEKYHIAKIFSKPYDITKLASLVERYGESEPVAI